MTEENQEFTKDFVALAGDIVSAYVSNNSMPAAELPALILNIHSALLGLAGPAAPAPVAAEAVEKPSPAQIRKSVTPDAIISFIDGKPYKTLKRHLTTHGLDIEGYRRRYGLPADYPTVSANYSAARSALAKDLGLGQQRRKPSAKAAETVDEVVAEAPAEPRRKSGTSGEGRKPGGRRKAAA